MDELIMERRSLLKGLVALVAAPAIIKVADLMPVKASLQPIGLNYDTATGIWSEVWRDEFIDDLRFVDGSQWTDKEMLSLKARQAFHNGQWENSPGFIQRVNQQYDDQFGAQGAKIGDTLRIRLPNDYTVTRNPLFPAINDMAGKLATPDKLGIAAAAIAVAPIVLKTPVTRRLWLRVSAA
jgi:hypothetical protein